MLKLKVKHLDLRRNLKIRNVKDIVGSCEDTRDVLNSEIAEENLFTGDVKRSGTVECSKDDVQSEESDLEVDGQNCDHASTDESVGVDSHSSEDEHSSCNVDYRLETFQDIGRKMKNNPGAYYDHNESGWFCSICISFGGTSGKGRVWI